MGPQKTVIFLLIILSLFVVPLPAARAAAGISLLNIAEIIDMTESSKHKLLPPFTAAILFLGNISGESVRANTSVCIGADCRTAWPEGGNVSGGNTTAEILAVTNNTADWRAIKFYGQYNWTPADTWNIFDGNLLTFNESKLASIYYNATQAGIIAGTVDGGTINDTQHPDGNYDDVTFNFSEAAGSPGLDMRINFTNVDTFSRGVMRYKTSSLAGNYPIIQMWNYNASSWEDYPPVAQSLSFATITQPVFDATNHVSGNVAQMRIYKAANGNTNNHYYVDWIAIVSGYGVPSGQEVDPLSFHRNENLNNSGFNITGDYGFFEGRVGIGTTTPGASIHSIGEDRGIINEYTYAVFTGGGKMYPGGFNYADIDKPGGGGGYTTAATGGGGFAGGVFKGGDGGSLYGGGGAGVVALGGDAEVTKGGTGGSGIYAKAGVTGATATDGPVAGGYFDGSGKNSIIAMNGSVGIGTTTPTSELTVNGNVTIGTSEDDHYIYFYEDGSPTGEFLRWDNEWDHFELSDKLYVTDMIQSISTIMGNIVIGSTKIYSSGDIYTTGAGDDFWLGTFTQADSLFRAYANGSLVVNDVVSADGYTGQPYGWASLDDDSISTTAIIIFGNGSAETTTEDGVVWNSTSNQFEIQKSGVYEVTIHGIIGSVSLGFFDMGIHVNDVINHSVHLRCHSAVTPFSSSTNWIGYLNEGDTVDAFIVSGAINLNWDLDSTFTVKRIS